MGEILLFVVFIVVIAVWLASRSGGGTRAPGMDFKVAGPTQSDAELNELLQNGRTLNSVGDPIPRGINFMKKEQPMIAVDDVDFIRTKMEWVSGNAGVSFRVAKGVTLRTGRSKGRRVETPHVLDNGTLVATTKCFYFIGTRNTAKYPYEKLMLCRLNQSGNTIELTKNTSNAKTEYFEHNDRGTSAKMLGAYYVYERFTMDPDAGDMEYTDDPPTAIVIDGGIDAV